MDLAGTTALLLAGLTPASHGRWWAAQGRGQVAAEPRRVLRFARVPQMHTPDIGGQGTTSEAIQDIIRHIRIINGRAVEA